MSDSSLPAGGSAGPSTVIREVSTMGAKLPRPVTPSTTTRAIGCRLPGTPPARV